MSKGFLIYAYNNEQHDYFKQAVFVADRITKFMDFPVTIVTDKASVDSRTTGYNIIEVDSEAHGKRMMERTESDSKATWKNANRYTAYEITPYDETIVIDSDYIVSSNRLQSLFDYDIDFICPRYAFDVTNRNMFDGDRTFGQFKTPHYWATVLFFRKSAFAEEIFNNIATVKEYWKFFANLYKFDASLYRNDYALSIALLMAYDHRIDAIPNIGWALFTSSTDVKVSENGEVGAFTLAYDAWDGKKSVPVRTLISGNDLHCLNKYSMEEIIDARDIYSSL